MKRIREHNINTAEHFNEIFSSSEEMYDSYKNIRLYDKILNLGLFNVNSYLDYGCGNGGPLSKLKKDYPKLTITGVDISDEVVKKNKSKYPNCNFFLSDEFLKSPRKTDTIISTHTFEHLENPESMAQILLNCSAKKFLIIVPFKNSWSKCEQHLWRFESNSFHSYSPTYVLKGFTNRAGYTEILYFFDKTGTKRPPEILVKFYLFLVKLKYNHPLGLIKKILNFITFDLSDKYY